RNFIIGVNTTVPAKPPRTARGKALKKDLALIEDSGIGIAPEIATFDLNEHSPDSGGGQDRASDLLEQRQALSPRKQMAIKAAVDRTDPASDRSAGAQTGKVATKVLVKGLGEAKRTARIAQTVQDQRLQHHCDAAHQQPSKSSVFLVAGGSTTHL